MAAGLENGLLLAFDAGRSRLWEVALGSPAVALALTPGGTRSAVLTAAGQAPKVDPKAPPKPEMKASAKGDAKAAAATMPAAGTANWPTQVAGKSLDKWIQEIDDADPSHRVRREDDHSGRRDVRRPVRLPRPDRRHIRTPSRRR